MTARRLRSALRLANAALALAVCGVVARTALAPPQQDPWSPPPFDVSRNAAGGGTAATSPPSIEHIVAFIERTYGKRPAAAARVPAAPTPDDGPLPLALYKASSLLHGAGPEVVTLVSKDRARARHVTIRIGETEDGITFESVRCAARIAKITASRGEERFTYSLGIEDGASTVIVAAGPRPVPAESLRSGDPMGSLCADVAPGVRFVPYYGKDGAVAGLRVTGVDPKGPFARSGIRAGDAIVEMDGAKPTTPGDVAVRWRAGWRPKDVVVLATDRSDAKPSRIALH